MRLAARTTGTAKRRLAAMAIMALALLVAAGASSQQPAHTTVSHRRDQPGGPDPSSGARRRLLRSEREQRSRLIRLGTPFYCGPASTREVAITFDDGPGPRTVAILTLLRHAHAPATFFQIGIDALGRPKLARAEALAGEVGDHTLDHRDLDRLSTRAITHEIDGGERAVARVSGQRPVLFRPPYDATSPTIERLVRRAGLLEVLWSVDTRDWEGLSARRIHKVVRSELMPGGIILLHEQVQSVLPTLRWLLGELRRRHLRPVVVSRLLADAPPTTGQLRADHRGRSCVEFPYRGRSG